MSSRKSKRLHFKDLNTMRFLAFMAVFIFTAFPYADRSATNSLWAAFLRFLDGWGISGIDFFFTLSGFLIAVNALREIKYEDKFHLKAFFIRRVLRIFPVYLVMLILGFLVIPSLIQALKMNPIDLPNWIPYFLLYANFDIWHNGVNFVGFMIMPAIILVFVHYYIILGLVFKFFHRYLSYISVFLIIVGVLFRYIDLNSPLDYQFHTLYYASNIGMGCLLAIIVRNRKEFFQKMRNLPDKQVKLLYIIAGIFIFFGYSIIDHQLVTPILGILVPLSFSYLIFDQIFGLNSPFQFKKVKFMSDWGKMIYGMFMYHGLMVSLLVILWDTLDMNSVFFLEQILFPLVALSLSIFAANLSYIIIEKPLLRIRREFKKV